MTTTMMTTLRPQLGRPLSAPHSQKRFTNRGINLNRPSEVRFGRQPGRQLQHLVLGGQPHRQLGVGVDRIGPRLGEACQLGSEVHRCGGRSADCYPLPKAIKERRRVPRSPMMRCSVIHLAVGVADCRVRCLRIFIGSFVIGLGMVKLTALNGLWPMVWPRVVEPALTL